MEIKHALQYYFYKGLNSIVIIYTMQLAYTSHIKTTDCDKTTLFTQGIICPKGINGIFQ